MNAGKIINAIGGAAKAREITGLTKGRISHFVTGKDEIPDHWLKLFEAMYPDLDWPYLKGEAGPRRAQSRRLRRRATDKKSP